MAKTLPPALAKCYYFTVDMTSPDLVSGMRYTALDWPAAAKPVTQLCGLARRGVLWVDPDKNKTWEWRVKCHRGKCDCVGRPRNLFTVVVESTLDFDQDQINNDYAFLQDEASKRVAYEFSRTKSNKKTYFFLHEKYRDHFYENLAKNHSLAALTAKAENEGTANWLPFYQQYGHLSPDALHRDLSSGDLLKYVCVPFVYVELLGKHRRQDRVRYLLFEKPDERLDVAQKRAKRMFAVQSKGKNKKAFTAELWGRVERMSALWPTRFPLWAPFIETCIMLDCRIGIATI